MFFNMGGSEFMVIALVVLIAVGPEQLPGVLRKVGGFMRQARSMTAGLRSEFMSGLDEVKEIADPKHWMGTGTDDDPIVPRGLANGHDSADSNGQAEGRPSSDEARDPATNDPATNDLATNDPAANDPAANDLATNDAKSSSEATEGTTTSGEAEDVS